MALLRDRPTSEQSLNSLAKQIQPEYTKKSIQKLVYRFNAQSGIASLLYKINLLELMLQDSKFINDDNLKKKFEQKVNEKIAILKQDLDNPIIQTQKFIRVLNNINNNSDVGDANIFVRSKSLFWIFDMWKPEGSAKVTKELVKKNATYLAKRLQQDVTTMNLRDIIQVLDFVVTDFNKFLKFENIPDNVKEGILLVKQQAVVLITKVVLYTQEHEDATNFAEDQLDMTLPEDIIDQIKKMGLHLRF